MQQYLLSIYQPNGDLPATDVLRRIAADVEAVRDQMRAAGAWVFTAACTELRPPPSFIRAAMRSG